MQAHFGPFAFDLAARALRCDGRPVHLSPKAFDLLALLLRARPRAMSKSELHAALWPDTFVSDGSLAVLVAEIRRALGDNGRSRAYIRTANRFGYAFAAEDEPRPPSTDPPTGALTCVLSWNGAHRVLPAGDHVLGRDPAADVRIDAVGVSRRHAAIHVEARVVTLRDLGSKNGTFVGGARVAGTVPLGDDAEIRLGAVSLRFRRTADRSTTRTLGPLDI